jgi:hypothetical protein
MWDWDFGYDDPIYAEPDWTLLDEQPMPEFDAPLELDTSWLDDPYLDWGGGPGGDNTDGSGDWNTGGVSLGNLSGGGSMLGSVAKALGLTDKNGNINSNALLSLLTSLGMAGGLVNQNSATRDATAQLQEAARAANAKAEELIGGARANYQPYMQAGTQALSGLQGMVGNSNLSGKYGSLPAVSPVMGRTLSQLSIPQR